MQCSKQIRLDLILHHYVAYNANPIKSNANALNETRTALLPDAWMEASLVLGVNGPALLPMQYKMKRTAFTKRKIVEPTVLALTEDMKMAKDIAHRLRSSENSSHVEY